MKPSVSSKVKGCQSLTRKSSIRRFFVNMRLTEAVLMSTMQSMHFCDHVEHRNLLLAKRKLKACREYTAFVIRYFSIFTACQEYKLMKSIKLLHFSFRSSVVQIVDYFRYRLHHCSCQTAVQPSSI